MSVFKKYLAESYKEYNYRIKSILPLTDQAMDMIESVLRKYDLKDITNPRKTPLQEHPLEFYNERNKEVYIVDVTLGMPMSSYVLHAELKEALNTYESSIVVRSENDPIEIQTQMEKEKEGKEYETKLSTESDYHDSEQIKEEPAYGDDYNQKFLSRIAKAKIALATDVAKDDSEFNRDHDGVKPHYGKAASDNSIDLAKNGNFDDERKTKNGVR